MQMNKTPRTDEQILHHDNGNGHPSAFVFASFARELEEELIEARAEIESKEKLVEQMREALRAWVRRPDIPLREAIKVTEAALEAAEKVG